MLKWIVGDVQVTQVVETEAPVPLEALFPDADPSELDGLPWVRPFFDDHGNARLSINSMLVQTPELRIVVDCCVGNDKARAYAGFNMQSTSYLDHLHDAGFDRRSVDVVVCTHLHIDHIGWCTMLRDGEWIPTFPNARYLVTHSELEYWRSQEDSLDERAAFADSVQPVLDAGLIDPVEPSHRISAEVRLIPTPGHTLGHASVRISSAGEEALITGDMVHHPAQIARPEWSVSVDHDGVQSALVRRQIFAEAASTSMLVIGSHFVEPSAGRITIDGDSYRFCVS